MIFFIWHYPSTHANKTHIDKTLCTDLGKKCCSHGREGSEVANMIFFTGHDPITHANKIHMDKTLCTDLGKKCYSHGRRGSEVANMLFFTRRYPITHANNTHAEKISGQIFVRKDTLTAARAMKYRI